MIDNNGHVRCVRGVDSSPAEIAARQRFGQLWSSAGGSGLRPAHSRSPSPSHPLADAFEHTTVVSFSAPASWDEIRDAAIRVSETRTRQACARASGLSLAEPRIDESHLGDEFRAGSPARSLVRTCSPLARSFSGPNREREHVSVTVESGHHGSEVSRQTYHFSSGWHSTLDERVHCRNQNEFASPCGTSFGVQSWPAQCPPDCQGLPPHLSLCEPQVGLADVGSQCVYSVASPRQEHFGVDPTPSFMIPSALVTGTTDCVIPSPRPTLGLWPRGQLASAAQISNTNCGTSLESGRIPSETSRLYPPSQGFSGTPLFSLQETNCNRSGAVAPQRPRIVSPSPARFPRQLSISSKPSDGGQMLVHGRDTTLLAGMAKSVDPGAKPQMDAELPKAKVSFSWPHGPQQFMPDPEAASRQRSPQGSTSRTASPVLRSASPCGQTRSPSFHASPVAQPVEKRQASCRPRQGAVHWGSVSPMPAPNPSCAAPPQPAIPPLPATTLPQPCPSSLISEAHSSRSSETYPGPPAHQRDLGDFHENSLLDSIATDLTTLHFQADVLQLSHRDGLLDHVLMDLGVI